MTEQAKDPTSYTDIELEAMRLDKKPLIQLQYNGIMKLRRKINRDKKKKAAEEKVTVSGEEIDRMRKEDKKGYAKLVKTLGKRYKKELLIMINSTTQYPQDTIIGFKRTVQAIDSGLWHPTTPQMKAWRPKRRRTAFDKHMDSE